MRLCVCIHVFLLAVCVTSSSFFSFSSLYRQCLFHLSPHVSRLLIYTGAVAMSCEGAILAKHNNSSSSSSSNSIDDKRANRIMRSVEVRYFSALSGQIGFDVTHEASNGSSVLPTDIDANAATAATNVKVYKKAKEGKEKGGGEGEKQAAVVASFVYGEAFP